MSEELRGDMDTVLAAVKSEGSALRFASNELTGDENIMTAAVSGREYSRGFAIKYASEELRGDKEIVHIVVNQSARALENASGKLRGDKEIFFIAVKQNGHVLEYASKELRGNKEVVLAAAAQNTGALQYASEVLLNDDQRMLSTWLVVTIRGVSLRLLQCSLLKELPALITNLMNTAASYGPTWGY